MEEQKNILLNSTKATLTYTGNVKVITTKNGKIIDTKYYHNNGSNLLHKFICECLAGQFASARELRPQYIRLFNGNTPASNAVLLNYSNIGTSGDTAVLHFTIPFAYINENIIDGARLYSAANREQPGNCSAEFTFTDKIEVTDGYKDNYNLIIEWEMCIANKETTIANDTSKGD